MIAARRVVSLATSFLVCACTTAYQASFPRPPEQLWPEEAGIDHCLLSLGFSDVSSSNLYSGWIAEHPELVAVWAPPAGSVWSDPPFSVAWVSRAATGWTVRFVPGNARGPDAKYFSSAFSDCLSLHSPGVEVEIESSRYLDLR